MANNPFGIDTVDDYGTLSGHGRGFRTRDGEIEDLKRRIGDTVLQIKQDTKNLQSMCALLTTDSDSEDLRRRIQNTTRSTLEKVERCHTLFKELTQLSKESSDRGIQLSIKQVQQNLTVATNLFHHVVQESMEKMRNNRVPTRLDMSGNVDLDEESDRAALVRTSSRGRAQDQTFMVSDEVTHIEERAQRMGDLESDIRNLNDIMLDIGKMVVTQGEAVDMIEKNVEDVVINVDEGNRQLEKGVKFKKCSRRLQCTIAIILIIVLILIIIVGVAVGCHLSHKCGS